MKKNAFLVGVCTAIITLCSIAVSAQQQNVPLKNNDVTPRRGDISNPLPNLEKRDTIHGAKDVSVVFGAGESSVIRGAIVRWPADHEAPSGPYEPKPADPPDFDGYQLDDQIYPSRKTSQIVGGWANEGSLLIGSKYSKNAVVGIYDNNGLAAGAVSGIRLYGIQNTTPPPPPFINGINGPRFEGEDSYGWWQWGNGEVDGNWGTEEAYNAGTFGSVTGWNYYTSANPHSTTPTVRGLPTGTNGGMTASGSNVWRWWVLNSQVTAADTIQPYEYSTSSLVPAQFTDASAYWSPAAAGTAPGTQPALPGGASHLLWNTGLGAYGYFITFNNSSGDIRGPALLERTNNYIHVTSGALVNYTSYTSVAAILKPYFNTLLRKYVVPVYNHNSMQSIPNINTSILNQKSFTFDVITADTMYTSTRNDKWKKDNGESLLYTISGQYNPIGILPTAQYGQYVTELNANAKYIRPTTILIEGFNEMEEIKISNVEWYAAFLTSGWKKDEYVGPFWTDGIACTHLSGWAAYKRAIVEFDTIKYDTDPMLTKPPLDGTYPSGRYVDAAVRILDKADVCVKGDVLDETTTTISGAASPNDSEGQYSYLDAGSEEKTNALLVLPGYKYTSGDLRSNFRLKIGGDANMRHFQDNNYYAFTATDNPLEDGWLYRNAESPIDAESPGEEFPNVNGSSVKNYDPTQFSEVYLSNDLAVGAPTYLEVEGLKWNYVHPRQQGTLTYDNTNNPAGNTSLPDSAWMPYARTSGSVYGVGGEYNGKANIYTLNIDKAETKSIIEIGETTNHQDLFHIYSGGMLKNFRSLCTDICGPMLLGWDGYAPNFYITTGDPLYIINDGNGSGTYCCNGTIVFYPSAVASLNTAIAGATGGGDVHIQSQGSVTFQQSVSVPDLDFTLIEDNEVKILSDNNFIHIENNLFFKDANLAHLTIWSLLGNEASDPLNAPVMRGDDALTCYDGTVRIDGDIEIDYSSGTSGTGLVLIRSDYDDVLFGNTFKFTNTQGNPGSGELMVQAGQDIRINGATDINQDGQRSLLFEAQKTIALGPFNATLGAVNGTMTDGDLTFKAGYPAPFFPNAEVANMNWGKGLCVINNQSYVNREANNLASSTGGDIWFQGPVNIKITPQTSDKVDVFIRAYNSVSKDDAFSLTYNGTNSFGTPNTIMTYAETGNIEAIGPTSGVSVEYNIEQNDWVDFLYQAGNTLGDPCGLMDCTMDIHHQWNGNILYAKPFTINHKGRGPTLISASRDIENQLNSPFTFNYDNTALDNTDNLTVTAGRHIETHAPYTFNYAASGISNNITMQAGRLTNDTYRCSEALCKTIELGTSLTTGSVLTNPLWGAQQTMRQDNFFAEGGEGQGSILAFSTINFDYKGQGTILMTAKNGNIETDPYLHGTRTYEGHGAQLMFEHAGTGLTRMEAIDIKLHDRMAYIATSPLQAGYGNLQIHAFDSILTRTLEYSNQNGNGSITITTDKLKPGTSCDEYVTANGGSGINQGHIVLGYGADCANGLNVNDSIIFDFTGNPTTSGANVIIRAGYLGYASNPLANGYGGNITFDFIYAHMAEGNHTSGGYMEISTPNGNIWGKDSLYLVSKEGDLYVDAGVGSEEDVLRAARWDVFSSYANGNGEDKTLNTEVPNNCPDGEMWRTGNIMMKGGYLNFQNGKGNATFRTREGFIDTYDAFTVEGMEGHLLKYAALDAGISENHYGDVSERDFQYNTIASSGSIFFGADDNIMLNYGNNNLLETAYNGRGAYNVNGLNGLAQTPNPFYSTSYKTVIEACRSVFDVNTNGYLWYKKHPSTYTPLHTMFRGSNGSPISGVCATSDNKARPLIFHFDETQDGSSTPINSGGLATVANNFIDVFTQFEFFGGTGTGLDAVPDMGQLHGEDVEGYGLFMKSQFQGGSTEYRRASCIPCGRQMAFPIDGRGSYPTFEWPYIGFHDDARIHTQNQKSIIEAPVIEFFGHAEMDVESGNGLNTDLTLKADSLIFHDSLIFKGVGLSLLPYTTGAPRLNDMRYGVINDDGNSTKYYRTFGPAIAMEDRNTPVLELGYQRCIPPGTRGNSAPNARSVAGLESTPYVGGDIIVAFKHDFTLPIFNTVVANHARISFLSDSLDKITGGEFVDSYIRTDLLRIRNHVEFYTAPGDQAKNRSGKVELVSYDQMPTVKFPGIYPHHLHLEPGSELSLPGEEGLTVGPTTTLGGFGGLHENVFVLEHGKLAPGFSSLMEEDCQTPHRQGTLTMHNLRMEKDALFRVSIGNNNFVTNADGKTLQVTLTDKVVVNDTVEIFGRVPVILFPEEEFIAPGIYTILEYGDNTGLSVDYVRNFFLPETNYFGYYFALDFMERGKVRLVVTTTPSPPIQRFIQIPLVDGVTTMPAAGMHYAQSNMDFTFRAKFESDVLAIKALGYITGEWNDLDAMRMQLSDGWFLYTIPRVLEPYVIYIGPELSSYEYVSNEVLNGVKVWTYKNTLYINVEAEDVVTVYNMTGIQYRKEKLNAGQNKITLDAGIYVVALSNGARYKVIIK